MNYDMVNKHILFILVLVIAFAGGALLFWNTPTSEEQQSLQQEEKPAENSEIPPSNESEKPSTVSSPTTPSVSSPSSSTKSEKGRLLFTITDDTLPLSEVSSILLTFGPLAARNDNATWIPISNVPHTYDLLQLKREGKLELVLDIPFPADTYDQMSLVINSVVVVKNGVAHTATLPHNIVYLPLLIPLRPNQTAAIELDVIADKSLHITGTGVIIFVPVVDVNVLGEIQIVQKSGSKVEFFNGLPKFAGSYGMDETGVMRKNSFGIDSLSRIELVGNIFVLIPQSLDRSLFTISPSEAMNAAINKGYIAKSNVLYAEIFEKQPVWHVSGATVNGTVVSVYVNAKTGSIEKVQ